MFMINDRKDEYTACAYTIEEGLVNAINHCVTEGLMIVSLDRIIEDEITIIYTDPDDGNNYDIAIYPIEI